MEFTPTHAVPAFLAFLATGFVVLLAGGVACLALLARKFDLARRLVVAALAVMALYGVVLLVVSLASSEKALALGQQKYFCEVDCHLAYSVEDISTTKTLGPEPQAVTANGSFYVVTVKVWFDQRTISPTRGNFPLAPAHRKVVVVDERGREYRVSPAGQEARARAEGRSASLFDWLQPGDARRATLVFDLPPDALNPRLLITTGDPLVAFVIGHEGSLLHKKIAFRLDPLTHSAAR